jgi:hypothetical protein
VGVDEARGLLERAGREHVLSLLAACAPVLDRAPGRRKLAFGREG